MLRLELSNFLIEVTWFSITMTTLAQYKTLVHAKALADGAKIQTAK